MTRKDYIATADSLREAGAKLAQTAWLDGRQALEIHKMYVSLMADIFAADNPRFQRERFEVRATY